MQCFVIHSFSVYSISDSYYFPLQVRHCFL